MFDVIGLSACIIFGIISLFSELYIFIWGKENEGDTFPSSLRDFIISIRSIFIICVALLYCFYKIFSILILHDTI
jgi:hypothetical protein